MLSPFSTVVVVVLCNDDDGDNCDGHGVESLMPIANCYSFSLCAMFMIRQVVLECSDEVCKLLTTRLSNAIRPEGFH